MQVFNYLILNDRSFNLYILLSFFCSCLIDEHGKHESDETKRQFFLFVITQWLNMASRSIKCPCCAYQTGDGSDLVIAALLNAHVAGTHTHTQNVAQPAQQRRPPRVERPVLKDNITEETWNAFVQSWEIFVQGNGIPVAEQTVQLYSACDMALKAKLTGRTCCTNC